MFNNSTAMMTPGVATIASNGQQRKWWMVWMEMDWLLCIALLFGLKW